MRRHDAIRDRLATFLAQDLGAAVHREQSIPELTYTDKRGVAHPARMDLVVTLPGSKSPDLLDITVVSPWSADAGLATASAARDGAAAEKAEDRKRRRYTGGRVIPIAFENGGLWGTTG